MAGCVGRDFEHHLAMQIRSYFSAHGNKLNVFICISEFFDKAEWVEDAHLRLFMSLLTLSL
jgi:hypothetical protein